MARCFQAGESAHVAWHKLLRSNQESEELLFAPEGVKPSHQSCSSHISGLCVCFTVQQSQIALSFICCPRKGVRQQCHRGGCRTRDVSHCGRNLGLPLLFLAKESVTVTDVPEAGFGEERSAPSTLYFNLQRHNSFLEAPLCLKAALSCLLTGMKQMKEPPQFSVRPASLCVALYTNLKAKHKGRSTDPVWIIQITMDGRIAPILLEGKSNLCLLLSCDECPPLPLAKLLGRTALSVE